MPATGPWSLAGVANFWKRRWWRTLPAYYLFLLVAMARLLRPALRDLRSGFSANRSTWLVGHGSFEEWKHGGSGHRWW